jgi:hypothetical protein
MNRHFSLISFPVLAILFFVVHSAGQQPASPRQPPLGIPNDAKYFNGKWYRVYTEKLNWAEARDKCARLGGQLCVVPDEATWCFVKSLAPGAQLWLGATDEKVTGVWKWIDDTPFTFTAWGRLQPDNSGGNQHYLFILKGEWNDIQKDGKWTSPDIRVVGYICEWKDK